MSCATAFRIPVRQFDYPDLLAQRLPHRIHMGGFSIPVANRKTDPDLALAYLRRAETWEMEGENDRAKTDFAEAFRLDPSLRE